MTRHRVLQYLSLPGILAIGGFWKMEFIAFAPFTAFGGLDNEQRWVRVISYIGLIGFIGSFRILVGLLGR
jgi:hypothetical protein